MRGRGDALVLWSLDAASKKQHPENPQGQILTLVAQTCYKQDLAATGERAWERAPERHPRATESTW